MSFCDFAEAFEAAALAIRREFGLSLFGFDAIVPSRPTSSARNQETHAAAYGTGASELNSVANGHVASQGGCKNCASAAPEIVVIDVNYFPSYKEVRDFPTRLKRFLRSKMQPA